jgi:hypothetical protein
MNLFIKYGNDKRVIIEVKSERSLVKMDSRLELCRTV